MISPLLLIGNGWKNKGLPSVLESAGVLQDSRLTVLVAGQDNPAPYQAAIERHHLHGARAIFGQPRPRCVEFFYAAADAYVGPSLEDAFGAASRGGHGLRFAGHHFHARTEAPKLFLTVRMASFSKTLRMSRLSQNGSVDCSKMANSAAV